MKKTLTLLFAMLLVAIATSCKKDDPKPAPSMVSISTIMLEANLSIQPPILLP